MFKFDFIFILEPKSIDQKNPTKTQPTKTSKPQDQFKKTF